MLSTWVALLTLDQAVKTDWAGKVDREPQTALIKQKDHK